jgi:FkbM family methyltransferase
MPELQRYRRTVRLAKWLIPAAARFLSSQRAQVTISLGETAAALLQGKGAGSGWDLAAEVSAAVPFIRAGATVFDVGANIGQWSRAVQAHVPDVRLYLFEPQEACARHLRNDGVKIDGATVVQAAVGEVEGSAHLHSPSHMAGNASLHDRKDTYFGEQIFTSTKVAVISIDSFMAQHAIESVDFMKMDIEGHELFALRGATKALTSGAIGAISFEFGSGNINSRTFFHDYWDLLTPYGYDIYRVLPRGRLLRIVRYDEDLEYYRGVSNYFAVLGQRIRREAPVQRRQRVSSILGYSSLGHLGARVRSSLRGFGP